MEGDIRADTQRPLGKTAVRVSQIGFGGAPLGELFERYHVALYRTLRPRGPLPARWWLHPVPLHEKLRREERGAVLRWFWIGGLGFGVVVLGCLLIVLGLLVAFVDA